MPLVTVTMFPGRSSQQKVAMVRAISEAIVEHAGATMENVQVVIHEVSRSNWASGGELVEVPAG